PACVAGAVAEEKERKTLDYLLTSDLQPLEIVLGKLASRLAYLALLVLTGLPVLGLLQFLGGVDPQLVLAGFAATALTMFSLAGLGILNSVLAAKPRTAILLTYAEAILYLAASMALHLLAWGKVPLLDWLHAGNIILALRSLRSAAATGAGPTAVLPTLLRDYALFHGAVTVLCLLTATAVLRAWSRWQASRRSRRSFRITFMPRRRPRVGRQPMVWKELYTEPMFRFGRITMAVVGALLYGLVLLGAFGFLCLFMLGSARGDLAETMNAGVRCIGTPLACLMLLGVALHAASSISAERERQTFDSLLSSPLSNEAILRAKWIGSIASVRRLGWYLGAIGVVGVFTGGLFPLAVPLLLIAWLIYASFLASLGLTFSLFCCSTTRATVWTLVTIVGLTGGHWLCGMWLNLRFASAPTRGNTDHATWIIELQKYALTPPLTLYLLAFDSNEAEGGLHDVDDFWPTYHKWSSGRSAYWRKGLLSCGRLLAASFGLGCYAVAAWVLWAVARQNFTQVTGRMPLPFHLLRPERAHFLRLPDPDQTAKQRGGAR
ncbi:MAG TPA: ABC transporter permease subunit, partial [Gemmataceae bacterium]|nr:ABC transporter permease subunit [Gemmataceae bacterium]